MKKKYTILYIIDKFSFPLREAGRKQVWWMAEKKRDEGYCVEVIIITNRTESFERDGIKISLVEKGKFIFRHISADVIHFFNSSVSLGLFLPLHYKGYKILTLMDGGVFGETRLLFRKIMSKFLPLVYDEITVFSHFQKGLLNLKGVTIIPVLLPKIGNKKVEKNKFPTMFYMGHLSYFKGVDIIIRAFKILVKKYPNLKFVIANNGVRGDKDLINEVEDLKKIYPKNIVLKGIVDPFEELAKAWVYLYPFVKPDGTLAYPLSLYESLSVGTDFVACDVGSNGEFFDKKYLIPVGDEAKLIEKIEEIFCAYRRC